MERQTPRRNSILPVVTFFGVAILLLAHAHQYAAFLSDDALISLRYAHRLVDGHGLTWSGTERVEGYTDFLWVVLTGIGTWLGFDTIATALTLDKLGALLALAMLGLSPRSGRISWARLVAGGGLLAASIPVAVWANGGLEHGLMIGVLMIALYRSIRRAQPEASASGSPWVDGLPLAALALLRADGIVIGFFLTLGPALAWGTKSLRIRFLELARAFTPPTVALLAQSLFRRAYYGTWQPNTAVAKLTFNWDRLRLGFNHLREGFTAIAVLAVAAILCTAYLARRRLRAPILVPWTVIVGWSLYLACVGGDIFPGWRQFIFVLPPMTMLAADFAEVFTERRKMSSGLVLVLATAVVGACHLGVQSSDRENRRAGQELWEWDGLSIGSLLRQAFGAKKPLLAVDAAGALPYWSNLPSLDMLGLNDAYIAHHPPPDFGHGPIGHELGDGAYVFGRRPDLIAFNNAGGHHVPLFLSGKQLLATPEFHHQYQWIKVQGSAGNRATGEIWVRREESGLGILRETDRILVPGYFLTGQASEAIARLDGQGRLAAETTNSAPGILPAMPMPAGRWRVRISPENPELVMDLRCEGRSMERVRTTNEMVFDLDKSREISVALGPKRLETNKRTISMLEFVREINSEPTHRCAPDGQPLTVDLVELMNTKPENFYWAHPENHVVDAHGLRVHLANPRIISRIELSVDNNDIYEVRLQRDGHPLWRGRTSREPNGGGLAVRWMDLPAPVATTPGDELVIEPVDGDGSFSIGHVALIEKH